MFSNILVAIDGSESSHHALRQTIPLARAEQSSIRVISVVPPYQGELRLVGVKQHVSDLLTDPYRRALATAEDAARETGTRIYTTLEAGDPHEKIVEIAEAQGCDLIVVGVRGHNPAEELLMGSMTERVIGFSHTDVLVVPLGKNLATDNILIAIDGSTESKRAVDLAFRFHRSYGSQLTILAVADVPPHIYGISAEVADEIIVKARKELEQVKIKSQEEDIIAELLLHEGDPSHVITDIARKRNSNLILMGSHGRSGLKRLLMGRVTERVIGRAPCPVLVART
jgi:nucleotide-binding universal stress UspA family protein